MKAATEVMFQQWYKHWNEKTGGHLHPDPDNPLHFYDFRRAFIEGAAPEWKPEHQQYRWPDKYKSKAYPWNFLEGHE